MTFGATCSLCTALYVMKKNTKDYNARAIKAIDSFDTVEEAIEVSLQVKNIHKDGRFDLRGFTSNSNDENSSLKVTPANEGVEKVFGLYWESVLDSFKFDLKFKRVSQDIISGNEMSTRRQMLSVIISTFDPLGFLSHYIVGDEPISDDINTSWEKWHKQLNTFLIFVYHGFTFKAI